ncbi:MAG: class I SAM-dependent methyltransferase [Thermomicrobiales bacterium]
MTATPRGDLLRRTLALYATSPRAERTFVHIRAALSDLTRLERHAPRAGAILDLGCGHGLVANLLALGSPARDVIGIDLDAQKIAAAHRTVGQRTNIHFAVADATTYHGGPYAAITTADVFYLLPPAAQRRLLTACYAMLAPGGLFLWKSQVRRPRWKYAVTWGQEWLMTHLGPTTGYGLYFLDTAESLAALEAAGFRALALPLRSWRPYTDMLFLAWKSAELQVAG